MSVHPAPAPTIVPSPTPMSVVDRIKEYILVNRLSPGDLLPTENELSERLAVSRSRVREAIKTLTALDIVEVRHGHGMYVGRMTLTAMVESLAFRGLLTSAQGDRRVITDLVDLRQMLETSLADTAIERLTPEAAQGMRRLAHAMRGNAARGRDSAAEDRAFHVLLTETTGNALAVQLTAAFWEVYDISASTIGTSTDLLTTAEAHVSIVDALEAGNVEHLRQAIVDHYAPIRRRLRAPAGTKDAPPDTVERNGRPG